MKTRNLIAVVALSAATIVGVARAQTNTETFNFSLTNAVPDANLSGLADARTVTMATPGGLISEMKVTLELSGGYNGDLYAYLTHGSGFAVLLNRPGRTSGNLFGYGDAGFNVTFSTSAATDIHLYGGNSGLQLTGNWQPDGRITHPSLALDTDARSAFLDSFNNGNADGVWTLFLADLSAGQQSTLNNWSLEVTTIIPEPATWTLAVLGSLVMFVGVRHLRRRP